jgi:small GTP-binding protein
MTRRFVLLGNVDHGKSTLAGRILVNIGDIPDRELEKMKLEAKKKNMQSWYLAYLMDTDEVEREKGKTVDYIFKDITWKDNQLTIVDVPGHKTYVPHMTNGCSMADIAVLIISARKGEFEAGLKGQTMEHVVIARGMGISTLIVVVNKMDTVEWDLDIYTKIKQSFEKKVKKLRYKKITFIPVSAYNGDNVTELRDDAVNFGVEQPLMDIISTIDYAPQNNVELEVDENSIISTKFLYYNIPQLISSGLNCILHSKENYYEATIMGFYHDGKPFISMANNPKQPVDTIIKLKDKPKSFYSNLVIRLNDETIGLARVVPDDKIHPSLQAAKKRLIIKEARELDEQKRN